MNDFIKFGDYEFTVTETTMSGRCTNPHPYRPFEMPESALYWHLQISGIYYFENEWGRFDQTISFADESLKIPGLCRWIDLVGTTIELDYSPGEIREFSPTVFMEDDNIEIPKSKFQFMERDGCNLRLQWEGVSEASPFYSKETPFYIDCWFTFEGIDVHCNKEDDAATIRSILAAHLDPDDFIQHPKIYPGSIGWFTPKC